MDRDQWLRRRTYRGADYDPDRLAEAARRAGLSVSVCLPALNVAATVGPIVSAVRKDYALHTVDILLQAVEQDSDTGRIEPCSK